MSTKNEPTLQEQLAQLDAMIVWFDRDDFDLDQALEKFEEGVKLAETIKSRLATLENKITILRKRFTQDGEG